MLRAPMFVITYTAMNSFTGNALGESYVVDLSEGEVKFHYISGRSSTRL